MKNVIQPWICVSKTDAPLQKATYWEIKDLSEMIYT